MTRKISTSPDSADKRTYTRPFIRNPGSVPQRWRFEERDQTMLETIYRYEGMLTTCQLEALYFSPNLPTENVRSAKRSAETRQQHLFHKGYLDRLPAPSLGPGRSTILNVLGKAGVDFVTMRLGVDRAHVDWRPKIVKNKASSHLHSLLVSDLRITMERITRLTNLTLENWIGERAFKSKTMADKLPFLSTGYTKSAKKAPDGAFLIEYPAADYQGQPVKPVGFFVEVDRGTESNAVWAEKVRAYEQFRQSGLAEHYYGVSNFRILTTVSTPQRLENLMKTTSDIGGGPFYWFTLQDNIDIFQPWRILDEIWIVVGWVGHYSLKSLKVSPKK